MNDISLLPSSFWVNAWRTWGVWPTDIIESSLHHVSSDQPKGWSFEADLRHWLSKSNWEDDVVTRTTQLVWIIRPNWSEEQEQFPISQENWKFFTFSCDEFDDQFDLVFLTGLTTEWALRILSSPGKPWGQTVVLAKTQFRRSMRDRPIGSYWVSPMIHSIWSKLRHLTSHWRTVAGQPNPPDSDRIHWRWGRAELPDMISQYHRRYGESWNVHSSMNVMSLLDLLDGHLILRSSGKRPNIGNSPIHQQILGFPMHRSPMI
jgi:hypothetical protein